MERDPDGGSRRSSGSGRRSGLRAPRWRSKLISGDPVVLTERPRRPARAWVEAWPGWKHFDHLLVLLKVDYSAMARDAFDGLDARRCVLGAGGGCELWHDDWRFKTLVAPTRSAEALIRRIGQDLERAVQSTSC